MNIYLCNSRHINGARKTLQLHALKSNCAHRGQHLELLARILQNWDRFIVFTTLKVVNWYQISRFQAFTIKQSSSEDNWKLVKFCAVCAFVFPSSSCYCVEFMENCKLVRLDCNLRQWMMIFGMYPFCDLLQGLSNRTWTLHPDFELRCIPNRGIEPNWQSQTQSICSKPPNPTNSRTFVDYLGPACSLLPCYCE